MSQIAIVTKCDSFIGKVVFNWSKQNFKYLIEYLDFIDPKKNGQSSYFKKMRIPYTQKQCTLVAYSNGTMVINGCQDQSQMKTILNQFVEALSLKAKSNIRIIQNLQVTSSRSITKLGRQLDIRKLHKDLFAVSGQKIKDIQYHTAEQDKVTIPQQMHRYKNVKIFVNHMGTIQIYKAHLIPNLNSFVRKFSQYLIRNYVKQEKQDIQSKQPNYHKYSSNFSKHKIIKKQVKKSNISFDKQQNKGTQSSEEYELEEEKQCQYYSEESEQNFGEYSQENNSCS